MRIKMTLGGSGLSCRIKLVLGMLGLFLLFYSAQAQEFSGDINFNGGAILNSPLGSASSLASYFGPSGTGNPEVSGTLSGIYSGVPEGTPVAFSPFTFTPAPLSGTNFWSFTIGAITYSFDITSVSSATYVQNSNFLNLSGDGIAYVTGYSPTPATWYITDTGNGSLSVTFNSGVNAVPEPFGLSVISVGMLFLILLTPRYRGNRREAIGVRQLS